MNGNNLRDNIGNRSEGLGLHSTTSSNNKEYNSIPSGRFYTEKEEVTLRFYQIPKALFRNPVYKGLDLGLKLMYSVLMDRLYLSIKKTGKMKRVIST